MPPMLCILAITGEEDYVVRHLCHGPVNEIRDDAGNRYHRFLGTRTDHDVECWFTRQRKPPTRITLVHSGSAYETVVAVMQDAPPKIVKAGPKPTRSALDEFDYR